MTLTMLSLCLAGDNELSLGFLPPARGYLRALRDCSNQALEDDDAYPCGEMDATKQTEAKAITPGDRTVLGTLNNWDIILKVYQSWMVAPGPNEEQRTRARNKMQHRVDVCSLELGETLRTGVVLEKSGCDEALESQK